MSILSPISTADQWEIFLTLPDGSHQQVDALGIFGSFALAAKAADILTRYLHRGEQSPGVQFALCNRDAEDRDDLLDLPRNLYRRGIDPARVAVEVERYGAVAFCPQVDEDDTILEPVEVFEQPSHESL